MRHSNPGIRNSILDPRSSILAFILLSALATCLALAAAPPDDEPDASVSAPNRELQLAAMRKIAGGLKITVGDEDPREVEMIGEPLFRFNDSARDFSDGSIWGYGGKGRPLAILSLSLHPHNGDRLGWLYEINSLTSLPVEGRFAGPQTWSTRKPGLEFQELPNGPAGAARESGRNRQFRELSARFSGYESFRKSPTAKLERYELRLIPRPIHRYADPDTGLIDGALFLLSYGTNPEVVLAIELVRETDERTVWKYALTRTSYAELHVELDGKPIWTPPHLDGTRSSDPYWLFFLPVKNEELDPQ
jgi:hypothetical protein